MANILIVAEHDGKSLNPSTSKTVAAAATIADATIDVLVLAENGSSIAEQAASLESVARVLVADDPANAHPVAAIQAPQVVVTTG